MYTNNINFQSFKLHCERHHWYTCRIAVDSSFTNERTETFYDSAMTVEKFLIESFTTLRRYTDGDLSLFDRTFSPCRRICTWHHAFKISACILRMDDSTPRLKHSLGPRSFVMQVTHSVIRRSDPRLSHATHCKYMELLAYHRDC